jgi:hypothetical protein
MWQADQVLASRAELHGVDAATTNPQQAALDERARKSALRTKVYNLRDKVWTASRDELRERLGRLSLEGEPELAKLADRLRVIVESRARLPLLTEHRNFDGDFFECFKEVLTGSVRQSAEMRERVAASFQDRRLKKRGLRMIKLLRREVPELAVLERPWLEQLQRRKGTLRRGKNKGESEAIPGLGGWFTGTWWAWILLYVLIKLLVGLARSGASG